MTKHILYFDKLTENGGYICLDNDTARLMDSEARMTGTGGILNNVTMATGMKMRNPVVLICLKPLLYLEVKKSRF
jgi:hypothetical protein